MTRLRLRITDQESARVVAILHNTSMTAMGAGCLLSSETILTCRHVIEYAIGQNGRPGKVSTGSQVEVQLIGLSEPMEGRKPLRLKAELERFLTGPDYADDLALLRIKPKRGVVLDVETIEFSTPIRHGGKLFHVMGFPGSNPQGRLAEGKLHAEDAYGLVQMDSLGRLLVRGGYSGAPVWSSDVNAFIGIVVTQARPNVRASPALVDESAEKGVAWCIPSRVISRFLPSIPVRFRMPESDRPRIHDRAIDDPNIQLFGRVSDDGNRRLTAKVRWSKEDEHYIVSVTYKTLKGSKPVRGKFVTFVTHPDFNDEGEDAYELFARVKSNGRAYQEFYPEDLFTVAAIGDAGDTALTLNLEAIKNRKKSKSKKREKR